LEIHFLDRRGSGLNAADRGDVDGMWTWLDDVEGYLDGLPVGLPRILLGISWGGKLAVAVARHRPQSIDGLALLCPGLFAKKGANRLQRLALALAGRLGLQACRVSVPLADPALFAFSPYWQAYVQNDPFTLRKVTVRLALADLELSRFATETAEQISAATLLMLAGRDCIIDNRRVGAFVERIGSSDTKVITYRDAPHTLEFQDDPATYLEDLCQWARHVATSSTRPKDQAVSESATGR
jgi:alpha-beta hydrolase superfamily lysophospholipase